MTRQEFIQMHDAAAKKATRRALIVVGCGWAIMLLVILSIKPLSAYIDRISADWTMLPSLYWFKGLVGLMLLALMLALKAVKPPKGILCPNCRNPIVGIPARLTSITGNCSHCGETILSAE
jgi:hypothetical protein